jgi:hypothetical protein
MKTLLRLINIVLAPILTVVFTQAIAIRFARSAAAERDVSQALGVVAAGITVLSIELFLGTGPKLFRPVRRWLDPRAVFEGFWLQEVYAGHPGNRLGCFAFKYDRRTDTYSVTGNAYSESGARWAKFRSTHVFFTPGAAKVDYLWDGEVVGRADQPEFEKHGLSKLELRNLKSFRLPMSGDGSVLHLGEQSKLAFKLSRVTNSGLRKLGLNFELTDLLLDGDNEESQLVKAILADQASKRVGSNPDSSGASVSAK